MLFKLEDPNDPSFVPANLAPLLVLFKEFDQRHRLLKRMLRIVCKDYKSSFAELLSEDKSFTVHHRNVQKLAIEMYEVKNELCPKILLDLFKEVTHPFDLRNGLICGSYKIKTVRYGSETITYFGPKIWLIAPDEIRESVSLETFHQKIKLWKPDSYPCRMSHL